MWQMSAMVFGGRVSEEGEISEGANVRSQWPRSSGHGPASWHYDVT